MTMSPIEGSHGIIRGRPGNCTVYFLSPARPYRGYYRTVSAKQNAWTNAPAGFNYIQPCLVMILSWNLANGVIARGLLNMADQTLREIDARIDPELPVPQILSVRQWSPLISWKRLGAQGRRFVSGGHSAEQISEISWG